ncbi:hypothetical protein LLEC1_01702 [Akanthomyces lecanii]|uniref:Uncharacterized protein n=1 Tax=Cordyceps confragosa TaxID=2714763 RepID=A0A179IDE2_CORDF|nr:hypothetical protein LLEC1_01702 [Akanthomyces lecanii]
MPSGLLDLCWNDASFGGLIVRTTRAWKAWRRARSLCIAISSTVQVFAANTPFSTWPDLDTANRSMRHSLSMEI